MRPICDVLNIGPLHVCDKNLIMSSTFHVATQHITTFMLLWKFTLCIPQYITSLYTNLKKVQAGCEFQHLSYQVLGHKDC